MYIIFLLTIIILIILLYSFNIEENITIISCIIIILLLNSILNKKSYDNFYGNDIVSQQEMYNSILDKIKHRYYSSLNKNISEDITPTIIVNNSNFNYIDNFGAVDKQECLKNVSLNGEKITDSEFIKILNKIQTINSPNNKKIY